MAQREQAQRGSKSGAAEEESADLPTGQASDLDADVDAILDEIDEVLEENAEDFVKSFVQKGGE
jgi:ubiquitin-like protein Pup